jgi:hypothetical protein
MDHQSNSDGKKWRKENQELLKQSKYEEVLKKIRSRLPVDWETQQDKEEGMEDNPTEG